MKCEMPTDYEAYEFNTHVFVVKIWLEEFHNDRKGIWRGHITHVPSGERQYIDGVLDVISFTIPYLVRMKAKINWFWRFIEFLRRKKRKASLAHSNPLSGENHHRHPS